MWEMTITSMCWMQTGATIDGYTVIEDGLKEGDKVVIAK